MTTMKIHVAHDWHSTSGRLYAPAVNSRRAPTVNMATSRQQPPGSADYRYLGACSYSCQNCRVLFWGEERSKSVSQVHAPGLCVQPRFLQLYIYDTANEIDSRMSYFGGQNSDLRRNTVEGLIDLLDTHNGLVLLPSLDMLGAIVSDMDYDIVLEGSSGYPQRVNKLHHSNMLLQFPLLFIYGQDGYSKDLISSTIMDT
ncbi:hypothetical protein Tco_0854043 [Tanacetum coccineum]